MTDVHKGQIISIPEGIGMITLIHQEFAYGDPAMQLSATIHVTMDDGTEVLVDRSRFKEIKVVRPVYGPDRQVIGYTIDGDALIVVPEKFKMLTT